jgi:membrane protein YdbS with pleckstrin-like domain
MAVLNKAIVIALFGRGETFLSLVWLVVFLCCLVSIVVGVLALILRRYNSTLWWICTAMVITALILSIGVGILDRVGYAR